MADSFISLTKIKIKTKFSAKMCYILNLFPTTKINYA